MKILFSFQDNEYMADLSSYIDISIPLRPNGENPNCFYAPHPKSAPVKSGDFVGSIEEGGVLNFKTISINPHGNGTHTECYAHIHSTEATINKSLNRFHFPALLMSVYPKELKNGDKVIGLSSLSFLKEENKENIDFERNNSLPEALIIRTLPNTDHKLQRNYSGTNPPYVSEAFLIEIRRRGVKHLLIDLPSVDKEQDDGKLVGHKAFWGINDEIQENNTITELIFVPNEIKDGLYLLQHSICPLELDASPSKPVIYNITKR